LIVLVADIGISTAERIALTVLMQEQMSCLVATDAGAEELTHLEFFDERERGLISISELEAATCYYPKKIEEIYQEQEYAELRSVTDLLGLPFKREVEARCNSPSFIDYNLKDKNRKPPVTLPGVFLM
jgi:hypothetical protein